MNIKEYKQYLINECVATAESSGTTPDEEFINYMIDLFNNNQEALELNICYFEMTGPRQRKIQIDGWGYDEADNTFILFTSYFDRSGSIQTITNTDIDNILRKMEAFVENSANGYIEQNAEFSSEGRATAAMLRRYIDQNQITKFKFYIISDIPLSNAVKKASKENILGKEVQIEIWDLERIFNSDTNNQQKEDISINVEDYVQGGLKCIRAFEEENDEYTAYLAVIPGTMLAKLYEQYGSLLLEGNVRSFLSMTGNVNKGIRGTIQNQPTYFFTYNNGIATTAKSVVVEDGKIKNITNLQIINGGQTTASIFFTKFNDKSNIVDLSKVFVPMKLTVVKNESKYSEVVEKISRYSNTQNKVSDADFFSNSKFHREFKDYSNAVYAPLTRGQLHATKWFYERTRGSYKQEQMKMTEAGRNKFKAINPKEQLITKTDLAKYYLCYLRRPDIVSKGAQYAMLAFAEYYEKNLAPKNSGEVDTASKVDEKFFKDCIALAIIFRKTDHLLQQQEWFPKGSGYKANIVAYAMAKLFDSVEEKYAGKKHVDLTRIWNEQDLYPELKSYMATLCKFALTRLTDESHGLVNVAQWAKKPACWEEMKKYKVEMPVDFDMSLVSQEEVKSQKRIAQADKKIVNDASAQIYVVKKGPDFWKKILVKCAERGIKINQIQENDVKVAINMYTKRPPNSFESKRLMKFLEMLQSEGLDIENL